jgi:hypothetical protein
LKRSYIGIEYSICDMRGDEDTKADEVMKAEAWYKAKKKHFVTLLSRGAALEPS